MADRPKKTQMGEMLIDFAAQRVCAADSKIGDVLERIAGDAKECWCCSMVRGIIVGAVGATVGWAAVSLLFKIV